MHISAVEEPRSDDRFSTSNPIQVSAVNPPAGLSQPDNIRDRLSQERIVAILRAAADALVCPVGEALAAAGINCIEITLTTPSHVPLVPTGGVKLDEIESYLSAGCIAVGIGEPLIGDALRAGGGLSQLAERATRAAAAAAAFGEARTL